MTLAERAHPPSILVVDDNQQLLRAIRLKLERDGYEVVVCESGDDAVLKLEAGLCPNILLTDAVMPGDTQGHDLASYIKSRHPLVPVVLMSAYLGAGDPRISDNSTIDRFIAKPLKLSDLSTQLSGLIGRSKRHAMAAIS